MGKAPGRGPASPLQDPQMAPRAAAGAAPVGGRDRPGPAGRSSVASGSGLGLPLFGGLPGNVGDRPRPSRQSGTIPRPGNAPQLSGSRGLPPSQRTEGRGA